ncbi:hypothetical protein C8F04DRAFT_1179632 [Mycena alexandri]|uniref:Uncharacterized protein n=1 Tax=Mycena alexandri TaxID=1745969 RepID=A0AAD6X4E7_9AGAR|nr:hypothetical protein C8F04DRAFT_1179632 [Mycena alexandri]
MAKKNEKQKAAANREASKRNKAIPFPPPRDLSFGTDPSYVAEGELDSESDAEPPSLISVQISIPGASKLKRRNPDTDLDPARESKKARESNKPSRTSEWRFDTGKTAIGRAAKMQVPMDTLFKRITNPRRVALAVQAREESEEFDSDIEMSDVPFTNKAVLIMAPENPSVESVPAAVQAELSSRGANLGLDAEMLAVNKESAVGAAPIEAASVLSPICTGTVNSPALEAAFMPSPIATEQMAAVNQDSTGAVDPAPIETAFAPSSIDTEVEDFPPSVQLPASIPVPPVVVLPADTETEIKAKHRLLQKLIKKLS